VFEQGIAKPQAADFRLPPSAMPLPVLILHDAKANRHSMNALMAALETDPALERLEFRPAVGLAQLAEELAAVRAEGKRAIVGMSFTTPELWRTGELMQQLRDDGPGVLWVAGGPHPTADPEGTLRLGFDVAVRGEGEATLIDLIKTVAADDDLSGVAGIVYRDGPEQVRHTPRRPSIDLNAYPPFPLRHRRVGPIEITRGCPFACAFCQTSPLLGGRPRHRSIELIARYAAEIRRKGACDVRLITPNAFSYGSIDGKTLNLPVLESLLAELRRTLGDLGRLFFGTFPSEVRPEHVTDATLDLVKRYANNDYLVIGAQSGSQRLLEHCGRGHSVADIFSAVRAALAAGMTPHIDFIFGLPGETDEDLDATIGVVRELAAQGAMIHAHTFMPLPQTRFALEPPGRIRGRLRVVLKELIRSDVMYGMWHVQEREAKRIARYLRQGKI
jgi:B12-binding domain/radical SAM domain protein